MDSDQFKSINVVRSRPNYFAIVSIYCGIIGVISLPALYSPMIVVTPIVSLAGLLSGLIALVLIHYPRSKYTGMMQAWAGLLLCAIAFCFAGRFYASLMNYVQQAQCDSKMRLIHLCMEEYVHSHQGRYPSTLGQLPLESASLYSKQYSFYYLHTRHPFVFNGYLAGKKRNQIANPEAVILVAEGNERGQTLFFSLADMNFTHPCPVLFAAGDQRHIRQQDIPKHFFQGGEDAWIIQPHYRK